MFRDYNRFPFLNIGVMVLTPERRFFNVLMEALKQDSDEGAEPLVGADSEQ